ncbi:HepT-like ribonuclease domain-containing protein [Paramicrobacterium fandaimingii]|uniref:HepT-like ribonuclease domain-containing protein n=1 Tax=Paramicrobacterium fandaimingii TaxID=2708079 RepID=UPI001423E86C|nr:HepT-like ribonuclease domain-containing protein [Microbacterium fandaimingii]
MINRAVSKEVLHIHAWLQRVAEIVRHGREASMRDELLQEAGDSLMMKLGEAAKRLSRLELLAPDGVDWSLAIANRNFIIHQYDEVDREQTWLTLSQDLPRWHSSLRPLIEDAQIALGLS